MKPIFDFTQSFTVIIEANLLTILQKRLIFGRKRGSVYNNGLVLKPMCINVDG